MRKFLQIMPCEAGWRAVYAVEPKKPTDQIVFFEPLIGWALCEGKEGDEYRSVEGLAGSDYIDSVEAANNFLGYANPGNSVADWVSEAEVHLKDEKKSRLEREEKRKAKELPPKSS